MNTPPPSLPWPGPPLAFLQRPRKGPGVRLKLLTTAPSIFATKIPGNRVGFFPAVDALRQATIEVNALFLGRLA